MTKSWTHLEMLMKAKLPKIMLIPEFAARTRENPTILHGLR